MKRVRLSSQVGKALRGSSRGATLVEVLVAIALMGTIAIAILSALSTASLALFTADKRATADSLARSQMEFVKNQDYDDINIPPQYTKLPEIPDGYDIDIEAVRLDPDDDGTDDDDGIQMITLVIKNSGKAVITLEGYKRNPEG